MRNNFDGFQNMGNNANRNMNSSNTMFMSSNFQNNPNVNQDRNNFNFMNSNQNTQMAQSQSFKKKLNVQLTRDENMLFNKLYNMLDNNNQGRIMGKPAANFMKTSGLDKNTLKQIWLIAAQNSNTQIEKEEFFVALRLIALAQNNMPFSAEVIDRNNPIPPLPNFNLNNNMNQNNNQSNYANRNINNYQNQSKDNLNNNQNNQNNNPNFNNNQNSIFDISESEKENYKNIFDNQKEPNMERIRAHNAIIVWQDNNADDNAIRAVANIIKPLENKGYMNLKEFQVACHLINISKNVQLPQKLPLSLVNFLGRNNNNMNNNDFQNMRFNNNMSNNNNNMSNNNNANNIGEYSRANTNPNFSHYLNTNNDLDESNFSISSKPLANAPFSNKNVNIINNNSNQKQNQNSGAIQDLFKREEELTKKNDILKNQINEAKNKIEDLLREISSIQNKQNNINNELNNLRQEINKFKNSGNQNNIDNTKNILQRNNNIDLNNNLIKKNIDDIAKNMRYDSSDLSEINNQNNMNMNTMPSNNDNNNLDNQNKKPNLMDLMNKMDLQNAMGNNNNNNMNQNNFNSNKQNENRINTDFDLDFDNDLKNVPKEGVNPYDLGNENKKEGDDSAQKNFDDDFNF